MKPHVDVATGEIYGCEKGTFHWFHEEGHLLFNKNPKTSFLLLIKGYTFQLWMLFMMASFVIRKAYILAVLLWAGYIGIEIYEEWWCNRYAKERCKEDKNE